MIKFVFQIVGRVKNSIFSSSGEFLNFGNENLIKSQLEFQLILNHFYWCWNFPKKWDLFI